MFLTVFFHWLYKNEICDSRKYPYPPPPTDGQWKFLGGGGGGVAKGLTFPRGMESAYERNFSQGCKRRDWSYETYLSICGLFWFVAQQKLEVDALSRKKNFKMFILNILFFAGSSLSSPL